MSGEASAGSLSVWVQSGVEVSAAWAADRVRVDAFPDADDDIAQPPRGDIVFAEPRIEQDSWYVPGAIGGSRIARDKEGAKAAASRAGRNATRSLPAAACSACR